MQFSQMNKNAFTPKRFPSKRKAFTLIEILLVIGILALLMGVTTQMLTSVGDTRGRARATADMELIATGLEAFNAQYGGYPRVSATTGEKTAAGDLYKCLVGKMMLRLRDDQVMMVDTPRPRKPFVDATKLLLRDPGDEFSDDVDPEKSGVYIADPWNEPYLYFYNIANTVGSFATTWRSPGFILLSKGPDKKAQNSQSMYTTGIIPDMDEYTSNEENIDNIIKGRDN